MNDPLPVGAAQNLLGRLFPSKTFGAPVKLEGDASTRVYYRAVGGSDSVTLMWAPDEAAVRAFVEMTALMRELGADTPLLHGHDGRLAALEDLGDTLLQNHIARLADDKVYAEYTAALDALAEFQDRARALEDKSHPCFSLSFDAEKLTYETGFADQHFLGGYLDSPMSGADREVARAGWRRINETLAERMETLAHRDLHSRNIMCLKERRVWIDYQDARMGRRLYDLASLLLDPYANLPEKMTDELADYYYRRVAGRGGAPWSRGQFRNLYELSGIQRLYKALGTFGYQTTARGVATYLPYIKPAAQKLLGLLDAREDMKKLRGVLSPRLASVVRG